MEDMPFNVLSASERRDILLRLAADADRTLSVPDDLFSQSTHTEQQQISLYHVHLPKLDDHDVIEWNRETDEIFRGPAFEEVEPLSSSLDDKGLASLD